ncbi:MAG TPA: ATP-binding domain-containing protein, partial [Thermoleophilia bacterium]|nr:ATP-binding domain-containing protein [Thermoleophilia bacterium]
TTILSPLGDGHACAAGLRGVERWRDRLEPLVAPDASGAGDREQPSGGDRRASPVPADASGAALGLGGPGVDTVSELAAGRRAGADVGHGAGALDEAGRGGPTDEATGPWPAACEPSDLDAVRLHSGRTRFTSIYRFKGLESPAVVITDLEDLDSPAACSLLYVGCTRALQRLTLLAHESLRGRLGATRTRTPGGDT